MSLATVQLANIVNGNSSTSQFQGKKIKTTGTTIASWKLMVASIFEFINLPKANQPQTNKIPMEKPKKIMN